MYTASAQNIIVHYHCLYNMHYYCTEPNFTLPLHRTSLYITIEQKMYTTTARNNILHFDCTEPNSTIPQHRATLHYHWTENVHSIAQNNTLHYHCTEQHYTLPLNGKFTPPLHRTKLYILYYNTGHCTLLQNRKCTLPLPLHRTTHTTTTTAQNQTV